MTTVALRRSPSGSSTPAAGFSSWRQRGLLAPMTDIADDKVVLDGNHPLAGMALVFTCTVTGIRPASSEELEHGHVHSGGEGCDA